MPEKSGAGMQGEQSMDENDGDMMVECAECSTYVLKKEAIEYRGRFYCSRECLPGRKDT